MVADDAPDVPARASDHPPARSPSRSRYRRGCRGTPIRTSATGRREAAPIPADDAPPSSPHLPYRGRSSRAQARRVSGTSRLALTCATSATTCPRKYSPASSLASLPIRTLAAVTFHRGLRVGTNLCDLRPTEILPCPRKPSRNGSVRAPDIPDKGTIRERVSGSLSYPTRWSAALN